jgi:limonene-1,2-epoxide hydrolase
VFNHREARDLTFEQLARAAHQRAIFFERLDQRHQAADVVGPGVMQLFKRFRG